MDFQTSHYKLTSQFIFSKCLSVRANLIVELLGSLFQYITQQQTPETQPSRRSPLERTTFHCHMLYNGKRKCDWRSSIIQTLPPFGRPPTSSTSSSSSFFSSTFLLERQTTLVLEKMQKWGKLV